MSENLSIKDKLAERGIASAASLSSNTSDPNSPIFAVTIPTSEIRGSIAPPVVNVNYWTAAGDKIFNNNAGNVGIGSSDPLAKLHIKGSALVESSGANSPRIGFVDTTGLAVSTAPAWYVDNSGGTFRVFRQPNISSAGAVAMSIDASRNTTVAGNLTVQGTGGLNVQGATGITFPDGSTQNTGAIGAIRTCPAGMSMVGLPGARYTFCMDTGIVRANTNHFSNAYAECWNAGLRLCTYEQASIACHGLANNVPTVLRDSIRASGMGRVAEISGGSFDNTTVFGGGNACNSWAGFTGWAQSRCCLY